MSDTPPNITDNDLPADTVLGKPSYEAKKLRLTFISCKQKLANPKLDEAERKALNFYIEQMRTIHPIADENKFRKWRKGVGGSGDTEIIKPYVVRDHTTHRPLLNPDGSVKTIPCIFENVTCYLDTINSQKASSLRRVDGVRAVSPIDQITYGAPNPYAYAYADAIKTKGK